MSQGTIAIVGGGAWGTALAVEFARSGAVVRLWMREPELVARMRERRDNPVYLPGVRVPQEVAPTTDAGEALRDADHALFVVPTRFARAVYRDLRPHLVPALPLIVACKGIEEDSLALPFDVARQEFGDSHPLAVLSGPSFASELASGHPTAVVVASYDAEMARVVQRRLSSPLLRLYTNDDPTGVQLAGAVKNVIAIAVGAADSLGTGLNARAALITRGLAEMTRLGVASGGRPETFAGLAGLGDLVLTCTGELSRNRAVGRRLGHGERLQDILSGSRAVAEGVHTTRSVRELGRRAGVELPIVEEVHRLLYEDGDPREALGRLMSRPLGAEIAPLTSNDER